MNIDIRESIISNFKDSSKKEIISTIENALKEKEEITLPGMGVFFEILWTNSSANLKNEIVDTISSNL